MGQVISSVGSTIAPNPGYTLVDVPFPGAIYAPIINSWTSLQAPAYWRAIDFKSSNLASFPRSVRLDGVDVKHRLDQILKRQPNPYQSPTTLWRKWWFDYSHYGQGFVEIERDSLFNPKALHNRQPEIVAPFRYLENDGSISQWYIVGASSSGVKAHIVAFSDMLALIGQSLDGMTAISPIGLHLETFERARLSDRYITRFLTRGGVMRGAIEIPGEATTEQIQSIHNEARRYSGADAEGDVPILTGGAKLSNAGLNNDQSKIIDIIELSTKQIAQLTGVDPWWLFDKNESKYTGDPQAMGEDVVRYLFRLIIEQSEDELLKLLSPAEQEQGYTVHIDPNSLIRGNVAAEATMATGLRNAGIIDANEARNDLGYPPKSDPEASVLKISGDTSPKSAPQKQSASVSVDKFWAILESAAHRVELKSSKAIEKAQGKVDSDPEGWIRWGNVFAEQQKTYATEALTPIFSTIEAVCGPQTFDAVAIGERYAQRLRSHFAKLARNETSTAPDLAQLIKEIHE